MKNLIIKNYHLKNQELPSYSSLNDGKRDKGEGNSSDEQYLHLKSVWNTFNFNTFRDFHNHYLKKVVLLLAKNETTKTTKMLKTTKVELEKNSDTDMHPFIENGKMELVKLQKDILKQIINIAQIMIKKTPEKYTI